MFTSFGMGDTFFILPACYHPTTVVMVDDDPNFLKSVALQLDDKLAILPFTSVDDVLHFINNKYKERLFSTRCFHNKQPDIMALRKELYNPHRFQEIIVTTLDYDMPNKNGLELMNTMQLPPEVHANSFVMLTGNLSSPDDPRLHGYSISERSFISKADPDCISKLMSIIQVKNEIVFQWASYELAQSLAQNPQENNLFLFDKNCLPLLDHHIAQRKICEIYLFDSQGSFLFLDKNGQLSWMIVRNEQGIKNTLQLATAFNAPQSVLRAIESRKMILSLYEKADFERIQPTQWDNYLLPATVLTTSTEYLGKFRLSEPPTYYYAFTDDFPNHGIETPKILTYQAYLNQQG